MAPRLSIVLLVTLPLAHALFKSKPKKQPTLLSRVLPIVILFTVLAVLAVILYLVYQTLISVGDAVEQKLDDQNIKLSRKGAEVEIEGVSYEKYRDLTQQAVVSAWNNSETKDYQSKFFKSKENKHHDVKKRMPTSI